MKKLLIVIFAIGMIAVVSNAASGSITVDSYLYSGVDYTSGLIVPLEAGTYEFYIEDGAWSSSYGSTDWMWNVNIYQTSTVEYTLGTFEIYTTPNEALSENSPASVHLTLSEDDNLYFFNDVSDIINPNSYGSVNIGVNFSPPVVPEPVSSILFVTGGAFLAGRRYLKRKSIDS
jgi:hypothetical protein